MKYFTEKYDNRLMDMGSSDDDETGFYAGFPQMLPWVGCNYDSGKYKKLLLIGESHYLPEDADEELLDPNTWYNENHSDYYSKGELIEQYTNTRTIINGGKWSSRAHGIYRDPERIVKELISKDSETYKSERTNSFQFVAYYNYFLRPARKGLSIKQSMEQVDEKIANDAFMELVHILQPDYVYFLSKFAYETHKKNNKNKYSFKTTYSPHPSCAWWNRKHINYHEMLLTGKEKFKEFLVANKVFE